MEEFFFSEFKWRPKTASNIIQRSEADHSQIIGGYITPIPLGFRHPWMRAYVSATKPYFLKSNVSY